MKNLILFNALLLSIFSYSQTNSDSILNLMSKKIIQLDSFVLISKNKEDKIEEKLNFLKIEFKKQKLLQDSIQIKISNFDSLLLKLDSTNESINKDFINSNKEIQNSLNKIKEDAKNLNLDINNSNLEINKVKESSKNNKENINLVSDELSENEKIGIYIVIFSILIILVVYVTLSRKWNAEAKEISKKQKEILEKQVEESQKLTDWLNNSVDQLKKNDNNHSFAIKCADQINKIESTLSDMDQNQRGHRMLIKSCERLEENLKNNGYTITKYLGDIYQSGMLFKDVQVDPESETPDSEGKEIVRILIPEVQFDGKIIQPASVIVK